MRYFHPLLRMDDSIDLFGDAQIFLTLDANSGYWLPKVYTEDGGKTVFTPHYELYQFIRMRLGLKNALATFQLVTNVVLAMIKGQCSVVYLDNIHIFFEKRKDHIEHTRSVFRLLNDTGVTLKLEKWVFHQQNRLSRTRD